MDRGEGSGDVDGDAGTIAMWQLGGRAIAIIGNSWACLTNIGLFWAIFDHYRS